MKKIMIALAAIGMAAGVQAAAVDWSATINGASTAGIVAGNYTAYFFGSTFDGTEAGLANALDSAGFALSGTKAATGTQTFTTDASSISYSIILVDTVKNMYATLGTGTATSYDPESSSGTEVKGSTTGQRVLGTASSGNLTWTAVTSVPEPTSGLLMLVGLGALALRRRRA